MQSIQLSELATRTFQAQSFALRAPGTPPAGGRRPAAAGPSRPRRSRQTPEEPRSSKGFLIILSIALLIGFLGVAFVAYTAFTPSVALTTP